ncbi:hypothetical protein BDV95DRAFT_463065, partial [Massariosphaeria phaeospora]
MGVKRSRQDSLSSSDAAASPTPSSPPVHVKIVHLDGDSALSDQPAVMKCSLPPHAPLTFASFDDYDVHYQKAHVNRCSECHRNFPDEHFLHLHIAENHDPISEAKRDRGEKIYQCLVSTCDRPCSTPAKRRLHCIDKHQFPRNYDFFIVNDGIDRRSSMLRPPHRRRSSTFSSASSVNGASGRRRGQSVASVTEGMDVVKDEAEEDGEDEDESDDDEEEKTPEGSTKSPFKLHGRGGFGRRGQSRARPGRGFGRGLAASSRPALAEAPAADAVDSLASNMSALKFVPHSVRVPQDRGRGLG